MTATRNTVTLDETERSSQMTQVEVLLGLANEVEFFTADDDTAYADVRVKGHRETYPIASQSFSDWLVRRYYEETDRTPSAAALVSATGLLQARARFDGAKRSVFIRVGECDGKLYLDLANDKWEVVEIDSDGWRVTVDPPVRFRRSRGMLSLPTPTKGGDINILKQLLNITSDTNFILAVSWLLAAMRPTGPYPILIVTGEQGSAKSTFTALLRRILDPNCAPTRALPRDERDFFIAANNGHILAFDNVSRLPPLLSDTMCRLATGASFSTRQLHTDREEILIHAARPIICNGIEEFVSRPDLADRAVSLTLRPVPDEERKLEREIWSEFHAHHPLILGVLLDAAVHGLRNFANVKLDRFPRMADFVQWVVACEPALWPAGSFLSAYCTNRDEVVEGILDGDSVAIAVRTLITQRGAWRGTASQLCEALAELSSGKDKQANLPTCPRALSGKLRRLAPSLRKGGIEISFDREGRNRNRMIHIIHVTPGPDAEEPETG